MKPIVAMDFDGVICDSIDECLLTAHNAYHHLEGDTSITQDVGALDPEFVTRFRHLRYLVRPASEYWVLVHWLKTDGGMLEVDRFEQLVIEYRDTLIEFESAFFQARVQLRSAGAAHWADLHLPYEEFSSGWHAVRAACTIHLVTTKDLESVRHFNRSWDLGLEDDHLWTHERACSKAWAIRQIATNEGCSPSEIAFVDDDPRHLRDVSVTGACCFWASWGYSGTAEGTESRDLPPISLGRIADLLCHLPHGGSR